MACNNTYTFSCCALLDSIGLFLSIGVPIPGGGGGIPGDIPGLATKKIIETLVRTEMINHISNINLRQSCKFGNFCEGFIFRETSHICEVS